MTIRESRQRLSEAEEAYKSAHPGRDLTEAREELTHARTEYQLECVAVVERLGRALEPFDREVKEWWSGHPDSYPLNQDCMHCDGVAFLDLGDLRALAALYEEIKNA
jgi:hypothetical protein